MSTVADRPLSTTPVQLGAGEVRPPDEAMLQAAQSDACVANRINGARGTIGGMIVGAALWAGLILAGAMLIHK